MMANSWLEEISQQLRGVADALWGEVRERGLLPLIQPVAPYNQTGLLQPAVTLGSVLSVVLLSGVAVTALGTLLIALIALYLLLVEVFGVTVELQPFGAPAR
jgi:hypothetical protein